jgi:hypothetical protein
MTGPRRIPAKHGGARPNTGGARPGAGRPKGSKTGVVLLKISPSRLRDLTAIVGTSQDPLFTCVAAANDPSLPIQTRLMAASIALPYLRPRLTASMVQHVAAGPSDASKRKVADLIDRLAEAKPLLDPPTAEIVVLPTTKESA